MAYPTQITLSSGKTVYAGDESDGITSRQVQVSVTYQLERADDDLLLVTERKAKEVEAAHDAVWRQVNREQTELRMDEMELPPPPPSDEDDPLGDQGDPDEDWPNDEPPFYGGHGGEPDGGGGAMPPPHHRAVPVEGLHACRTESGNGYGNGHGGPGTAGTEHPQPEINHPERLAQSIRKPQKLAIEAQARRLGLSDQALSEIIRERFGKTSFTPRFAVDKLTKAEADALLRALQALGHGEDRSAGTPQPMPA